MNIDLAALRALEREREIPFDTILAAIETALGDAGRVLVRASGTEPVVRVMVEAATHERALATAERLSGVVRERLAL